MENGHNMSVVYQIGDANASIADNSPFDVQNNGTTPHTPVVHDKEYNVSLRVIVLYAMIIIGTIGAAMVFVWMWYNRHRKSRVNSFIFNLTVADLLVVFLAILPQLIWEYLDREWTAGGFMCRFIKFQQSFVLMASTYMLVVIAVDRHQAIRAPLKTHWTVWRMAGCGWLASTLFSLPMFFVFHRTYNVDKGIYLCENIFRGKPDIHRQAFLTYIAIIVFLIPLIILLICYIRIFLKIAQKAAESKNSKRQSIKPGKVHLQSTPSSSLPRAKIKTLKMTLVIVAVYIMCGLPYFVCEMIMSYGNADIIGNNLYSILGSLAVANSIANPYVFLLFNANWKCVKSIKLCPFNATETDTRRFMYSSASTRSECTNTEFIRTYSKGAHSDSVEMTNLTN